jgi:predicted 3-demethylubiquinone-9 3-methyltransferase (glyoxalase superfamily)
MEFNLAGHRLIAFKADGASKFTPAISFMITCRDQKAIDKYWERFLAEGGKAGQCGWLTDKYGISWQVVPKNLPKLLKHKTDEGTQFLMETFLKMKKIEISALTYKAK